MFLQPRMIIAKAGIPKAKLAILSSCREFRQLYHGFSRFERAVDDEPVESFMGSLTGEKNISKEDSLTWVPHPRSGIYFPEGHERVMEDVPEGAASFGGQTVWLRNDEGFENSGSEHSHHPDSSEHFFMKQDSSEL